MNETQELENYLLNRMPAEQRLLFDAKLLVNRQLREQAQWQLSVYSLVKLYSRKTLREEIGAVHQKMFREEKFKCFREKISSIFKTKL